MRNDCKLGEQKLKTLLQKKLKKFTPEEVQQKSDSVRKLSENIVIIG